MRLAVVARQATGLESQLRALAARKRAKAQAVMANSAQRVLVRVLDLVKRDTNFMADHIIVEMREDGMAYIIGWRRGLFVGLLNPATGEIVTVFYVPFVIGGTRYMAGSDPLTPALEAERPILRRALARALSHA